MRLELPSYQNQIKALQQGRKIIYQGSPTPGPHIDTSPWPIRTQATQQEVSGRQASEASFVFRAAPRHLQYHLTSASCQISGSNRLSLECEPYCELHM